MRSILERSGAVTALFFMALPAAAHHSSSIYDVEAEVTLSGAVTRYEWANPHVYLFVEAGTDTGDAVEWAIEHGPTTAMRAYGWSKDTFVAGDRVSMTVNPPRDPNRRIARIVLLQKAGVTLFDSRNRAQTLYQNVPSRARASGLSGTWRSLATPGLPDFQRFFREPTDQSSWPLTDKGIAAVESYQEETMNPQMECVARTAPSVMVVGMQTIEVSDERVWLRSEYDTVERTVYMNIDSHEDAAYTNQGHSIGRWEDDTLVVDTAHFAEHRTGNAAELTSGLQKRLVERFELNPDRTTLTYHYELEDPEYLAAPVTGEVQWVYQPDLEFDPVECDLENARRFLGD